MQFDRAYYVAGLWSLNRHPDERELNAEYRDDEDFPPLHRYIQTTLLTSKRCPYCGNALEVFEHDQWEAELPGLAPDFARLAYCEYCAYWNWLSHGYEYDRSGSADAAMSVLTEFDPILPEGFTQEMASYLRRKPSLWHKLEPRAMERLVAGIFRANFRNVDVVHVGRPGDQGIDVLFVDAQSCRWLIQVKRRQSADHVEPFETVQRLLGTLLLNQSLHGIVASNANHFSFAAERCVKEVTNLGYTVQLLDRGKLTRMLGPLLPSRPWEPFLSVLSRQLPEEFKELVNAHRMRTEQLWLF